MYIPLILEFGRNDLLVGPTLLSAYYGLGAKGTRRGKVRSAFPRYRISAKNEQDVDLTITNQLGTSPNLTPSATMMKKGMGLSPDGIRRVQYYSTTKTLGCDATWPFDPAKVLG